MQIYYVQHIESGLIDGWYCTGIKASRALQEWRTDYPSDNFLVRIRMLGQSKTISKEKDLNHNKDRLGDTSD